VTNRFLCGFGEQIPLWGLWQCECGYNPAESGTSRYFSRCPNCMMIRGFINCPTCGLSRYVR